MANSNQYGPSNPIHPKRENPPCNKTTRRTPSDIRRGKNRFCSHRCAVVCKPRKYGDEIGEFVIKHLGKLRYIDMAAHFDIKRSNFVKVLDQMRQLGYAIPINNKKPAHLKTVKEKIVKPPKVKAMPVKTEKPDQRANRPGASQRKHMDRKPPVEMAKPKKDEKIFKTRVVKDGPIIVVLNDKNHTRLTARDEEHADRIRKQFAYLEKPVSARF